MTYEDQDDGQLLTLIAGSDRGALEALYNRYAAPVFSLAMNILRDQGAAETLFSTYGGELRATVLSAAR